MDSAQVVYFHARNDWRQWLQDNYATATEVWLRYPKKHTNKPRISYNDAVEEALCFGWIDSNLRSLDEQNSAQRFTPRKVKSTYSQPNVERLRRLRANGKLLPEIEKSIEGVIAQPFVFPADIIAAIKARPEAWEHYQQFSPAYQRIRVAYIESARKRPDEFTKRLNSFIEATAKNKQLGFGGIEAYY